MCVIVSHPLGPSEDKVFLGQSDFLWECPKYWRCMVYLELLRTTAADPKLKRLSLPDRENLVQFQRTFCPIELSPIPQPSEQRLYNALKSMSKNQTFLFFCAVPAYMYLILFPARQPDVGDHRGHGGRGSLPVRVGDTNTQKASDMKRESHCFTMGMTLVYVFCRW